VTDSVWPRRVRVGVSSVSRLEAGGSGSSLASASLARAGSLACHNLHALQEAPRIQLCALSVSLPCRTCTRAATRTQQPRRNTRLVSDSIGAATAAQPQRAQRSDYRALPALQHSKCCLQGQLRACLRVWSAEPEMMPSLPPGNSIMSAQDTLQAGRGVPPGGYCSPRGWDAARCTCCEVTALKPQKTLNSLFAWKAPSRQSNSHCIIAAPSS
jgi:hypothetical protein